MCSTSIILSTFSLTAVPQLRLSPPSIFISYEVDEGSPFNLQCVAELYPVMSMEWLHNIPDGGHYITNDVVLSINLFLLYCYRISHI